MSSREPGADCKIQVPYNMDIYKLCCIQILEGFNFIWTWWVVIKLEVKENKLTFRFGLLIGLLAFDIVSVFLKPSSLLIFSKTLSTIFKQIICQLHFCQWEGKKCVKRLKFTTMYKM